MVRAYILIQSQVGASGEVARDVAKIKGVTSAEAVTGPYDVIALVEARNLDELGRLVVGKVQAIGFNPGGGGTQRLTRLIGTHRSLVAILEGKPFTLAEALAIGAVDEVVPQNDVVRRATELAGYFGSRSKRAVTAIKRSVYFGGSMSLAEGLHLERTELLTALQSKDAQDVMIDYLAATDSTGELPIYNEAGATEPSEGRSREVAAAEAERPIAWEDLGSRSVRRQHADRATSAACPHGTRRGIHDYGCCAGDQISAHGGPAVRTRYRSLVGRSLISRGSQGAVSHGEG